jgi:hypothetical protein
MGVDLAAPQDHIDALRRAKGALGMERQPHGEDDL